MTDERITVYRCVWHEHGHPRERFFDHETAATRHATFLTNFHPGSKPLVYAMDVFPNDEELSA